MSLGVITKPGARTPPGPTRDREKSGQIAKVTSGARLQWFQTKRIGGPGHTKEPPDDFLGTKPRPRRHGRPVSSGFSQNALAVHESGQTFWQIGRAHV